MKKFLILFLTPVSVLENWMKTDPVVREETEKKMREEWVTWIEQHKGAIVEMPAGAGKTKRVTKDGTSDVKNEVMMYGVVQAESHEAASEMFVGHPHLGIPEASIEIMAINALTGMN